MSASATLFLWLSVGLTGLLCVGCASHENLVETGCTAPAPVTELGPNPATFGACDIERLANAGLTLRRSWHHVSVSGLTPLITFYRNGDGSAHVLVQSLVSKSLTEAAVLSAQAPVAESVFDKLLARTPDMAASKARPASNRVPCVDGGLVFLETAEHGASRRRTFELCDDEPGSDYPHKLAMAARAALPSCAVLPKYDAFSDLTRCLTLHGQIDAASEVSEALLKRRLTFARSGVLFWVGQKTVGADANAAWVGLAQSSSPWFMIYAVDGISDDAVDASGIVMINDYANYAPFQSTWTREDGVLKVKRIVVGEFSSKRPPVMN